MMFGSTLLPAVSIIRISDKLIKKVHCTFCGFLTKKNNGSLTARMRGRRNAAPEIFQPGYYLLRRLFSLISSIFFLILLSDTE